MIGAAMGDKVLSIVIVVNGRCVSAFTGMCATGMPDRFGLKLANFILYVWQEKANVLKFLCFGKLNSNGYNLPSTPPGIQEAKLDQTGSASGGYTKFSICFCNWEGFLTT